MPLRKLHINSVFVEPPDALSVFASFTLLQNPVRRTGACPHLIDGDTVTLPQAQSGSKACSGALVGPSSCTAPCPQDQLACLGAVNHLRDPGPGGTLALLLCLCVQLGGANKEQKGTTCHCSSTRTNCTYSSKLPWLPRAVPRWAWPWSPRPSGGHVTPALKPRRTWGFSGTDCHATWFGRPGSGESLPNSESQAGWQRGAADLRLSLPGAKSTEKSCHQWKWCPQWGGHLFSPSLPLQGLYSAGSRSSGRWHGQFKLPFPRVCSDTAARVHILSDPQGRVWLHKSHLQYGLADNRLFRVFLCLTWKLMTPLTVIVSFLRCSTSSFSKR